MAKIHIRGPLGWTTLDAHNRPEFTAIMSEWTQNGGDLSHLIACWQLVSTGIVTPSTRPPLTVLELATTHDLDNLDDVTPPAWPSALNPRWAGIDHDI